MDFYNIASIASTIIGVIIKGVGTLISWLQYRTNKKEKAHPGTAPSRTAPNLEDRFEKTHGGSIAVGFFKYPPLIDYEETDRKNVLLTGVYGAMLNRIAYNHALEIVPYPLNIGDSVAAVENGTVDFVACVFETAARKERRVAFTSFLYSVAVGGVVRGSDKCIRSHADLRKGAHKVVVCEGEIGHEIAEQTLKIPKRRLIIVDTHSIPEIVALVEAKQADIAILDLISGKTFLDQRRNRNPELKLIFQKRPLAVCPNGVMFQRDRSKLGSWLEDQFHNVREDRLLRDMEERALEAYRGIIHIL